METDRTKDRRPNLKRETEDRLPDLRTNKQRDPKTGRPEVGHVLHQGGDVREQVAAEDQRVEALHPADVLWEFLQPVPLQPQSVQRLHPEDKPERSSADGGRGQWGAGPPVIRSPTCVCLRVTAAARSLPCRATGAPAVRPRSPARRGSRSWTGPGAAASSGSSTAGSEN